jgi:hypothetical protein
MLIPTKLMNTLSLLKPARDINNSSGQFSEQHICEEIWQLMEIDVIRDELRED